MGGEIAEVKEETWDRVMAVNLKGVFLCCQAVGKYMIKNKVRGSIINIASTSSACSGVEIFAFVSHL